MVGWGGDKNINTKNMNRKNMKKLNSMHFKKEIVDHMLETQLEPVKKERNID
jgi:hypothetical protein